MEIKYTESAKDELEMFHRRQQKNLENIVKQEKYVFGDDIVEVTASDIRQAERQFVVLEERSLYRYPASSMLFKVYLILGILMTVFGLFYDKIIYIYGENPKQFMMIAMGVLITLFSFFGNYLLKLKIERRRRYEEMIRKEKSKEMC